MNKKRVVVAMSGGVDSSVCAYILKQEGYEVIGLTMLKSPDDFKQTDMANGANKEANPELDIVYDARRVAEMLDIPYHTIDLKKYFKEKVIDYFVNEYVSGHTPNPCIICNKYLKFDALLKEALAHNAFYIATGHYARIQYRGSKGRYILKKAKDKAKDQSYALYRLSQFQLEHTLLPMGEYTKKEIRTIAKEANIPVASKPDSQEICFIDTDYKDFIKHVAPEYIVAGEFVDKKGNVIGQHKGIPFYTVGQRKGLGIQSTRPLYVIKIDSKKNRILLGSEEDTYAEQFTVGSLNWITFDRLSETINVDVKIRYNFKERPAQVFPIEEDRVKVIFKEPQKSPAPGQAAVFYRGDELVGGGTIEDRVVLE